MYFLKYFIIIIIFVFYFNCGFSKDIPIEIESCHSTKEYITVFEYLEKNREFGLNRIQSMELASVIASGCKNAAKRFIRVSALLFKAKIDGPTTFQVASKFANKDDKVVKNFINIFQKMYMEKYLDLDAANSLEIANALSLNFKADPKIVEKDFNVLVKFCLSAEYLNLPKLKCVHLTKRVILNGEKFKVSLGKQFEKSFEYLYNTSGGPKVVSYKALDLAEKIVSYGPTSLDNFKRAYKYARSKSLNFDNSKALQFAINLASKSYRSSDIPIK